MTNLFKLLSVGALVLLVSGQPLNAKSGKTNGSKTFSINLENTDLVTALELLAQHAGLRLSPSNDVTGTVNYSFANVTLDDALKQIARENGLDYKYLPNKVLQVTKSFNTGVGRSPANEQTVGSGGTKLLKLKYLKVVDAYDLVSALVGKEDRLIRDEPSNSLLFVGSDSTFSVVRDTLASFDVMPQQILIEAHIVEINRNFSRDLGFSYGNPIASSVSGLTNKSGFINNPVATTPNFALQLGLGNIDGSVLSARLAAAESEGSAKILSRPKVVTINNRAANITSGITYSIRTLAAVSSGGGGADSAVASGVTQVSAGLTLNVTPTVLGDERVKLGINVSNSEPDESQKIDGIPGIITNTTNTEIIVNNGKTASVAGLVKNSFSEAEGGVPFLRKIPVIGWLLSSNTKANRDKELMVFITPRIVDRELKQMDTDLKEVADKFPEVTMDKKREPASVK